MWKRCLIFFKVNGQLQTILHQSKWQSLANTVTINAWKALWLIRCLTERPHLYLYDHYILESSYQYDHLLKCHVKCPYIW